MKILVTGFEPFGGESVNPAWEAVKAMKSLLGSAEIQMLQVPVIFYKAIDVVMDAVRRDWPDAVVCVGQAGGRFCVTPERLAINIDDARIPDNEGNQPLDRSIYPDGPAAIFSTLPVKAMVQAIRSGGLPSQLSNTAGTFVCNHLMYGVLYHLAQEFPHIRGGFIHVPYLPEQTLDRPDKPSMAREDITRALELAVEAIASCSSDIAAVEGQLH